jgi:CheY-like chemotaxis protein
METIDTINILLVDDHRVVREGLRRMLELESDFRVVGEASDVQEVLNQVKNAFSRGGTNGYQDAGRRRYLSHQASERGLPRL